MISACPCIYTPKATQYVSFPSVTSARSTDAKSSVNLDKLNALRNTYSLHRALRYMGRKERKSNRYYELVELLRTAWHGHVGRQSVVSYTLDDWCRCGLRSVEASFVRSSGCTQILSSVLGARKESKATH